MNLIERMVARCEVPGYCDPLEAVYEATCELIEASYITSITKVGPGYGESLEAAVKIVTTRAIGVQ